MTDSPLRFYRDRIFLFKKKHRSIFLKAPIFFFYFAALFLSGENNFFSHLKSRQCYVSFFEEKNLLRSPHFCGKSIFLKKNCRFFARSIFWGDHFFFGKKKKSLAPSIFFYWESVIQKNYLMWPKLFRLCFNSYWWMLLWQRQCQISFDLYVDNVYGFVVFSISKERLGSFYYLWALSSYFFSGGSGGGGALFFDFSYFSSPPPFFRSWIHHCFFSLK